MRFYGSLTLFLLIKGIRQIKKFINFSIKITEKSDRKYQKAQKEYKVRIIFRL